MKRWLWSSLVVLLLSACGGGGGGGGNPSPAPAPTPTPTPTPTPVPATTLGKTGGTLTIGRVTITAAPDALVDTVPLSARELTTVPALPSGFAQAGNGVEITVAAADQLKINGPLTVTVSYADAAVSDESSLVALHFDSLLNRYQAVRIHSLDTAANKITFDTRSFSTFALAVINVASLPAQFTANFVPATDGWSIANFGSYFSPDGNCLGMSAYSAWLAVDQPQESLRTKYTDQIARIVAVRAQLAQSQSWANQEWRVQQQLTDAYLGKVMKAYLALLGDPMIFVMGTTAGPRHAGVVYGYDNAGFKVYDVDVPNTQQNVPFANNVFGTYTTNTGTTFTRFGFVGLPSVGRTTDFRELTVEAQGGFATSSLIQLSAPQENQAISARQTNLQGALSGTLNTQAQLRAIVKGVEQTVPVAAGAFNSTIPVSAGQNTIVLIAGVPLAQQSNWYKNSAALIRNFQGPATASRMLVTLVWYQNGTDVDLYVTDPSNQTAWYSGRSTASGLVLDFDDTDGYGPEHTALTLAPAQGEYLIRVHYYSGSGVASGLITVVLNEGMPNQLVRQIPFSIASANSSNATPGSSGPDWATITRVNAQAGTIQ